MANEPVLSDDMIRERAHHIWEREGKPEGRACEHWQMARTELAMEMAGGTARLKPERKVADPVEPIEAVENLGSFPGLTDQDEELQYPMRRGRRPRGTRSGRPS